MTKKIFISILLLGCALSSSAQISLSDLLGGKKKDAISSSSIITDALMPSLSIVRQQYQLKHNGQYYGKGEKTFFGETYTLGVKIDGASYLQRGVMMPWENDESYQSKYNKPGYEPVLSQSSQRPLDGGEWQPVDLELGDPSCLLACSTDSLLFCHHDVINDFGLPTDLTEGTKQGYMIWAYATTDLQDSAMQVKLQLISHTIEAKGDSTSVDITPGTGIENVLGGVFVVPQVERPGYIKLLLVGVAAKDAKGNWSLQLLTKKPETAANEANMPKDSKKQRKKKKDKDTPADNPDPDIDSELTPIK